MSSDEPVPLRKRVKRAFRVATLIVPSWIALSVASAVPHPDALGRAMTQTLVPLWVLVAGALVIRGGALALGRRTSPDGVLSKIDVLTGAGSALSWTSALAIIGAVWLGWPSLALVGFLGSAVFHVVVLLALVAFRGDPLGGGAVRRRFVPEAVTEGESVVEELRLENVRVPAGFRLFVTGRVGPRWATTRHVVDAADAGEEMLLEAEIGPAVRGAHAAEPLELWLEDTFGLCRSALARIGAERLTVVPRATVAEHATPLLARGIGANAARPASPLPTEGALALREYRQGDDVRRIHWVRSLAARELVVRLPDELPPDRPRVQLVLDTIFSEALALSCHAPSELLDALVHTWLAVGRALVRSGARVTLVAAVPRGDEVVVVRHELQLRDEGEALRLGAQIRWQSSLRVESVLTDEETFIVSRSVLFVPPEKTKARWIVVVPKLSDPPWPSSSAASMPHPMGLSDNRWERVRGDDRRRAQALRDHAEAVLAMRTVVARPPAGSFLVRAGSGGPVVLEPLR